MLLYTRRVSCLDVSDSVCRSYSASCRRVPIYLRVNDTGIYTSVYFQYELIGNLSTLCQEYLLTASPVSCPILMAGCCYLQRAHRTAFRLSVMGRIDTKAKHRRPVSETALPSRGQRKRALKKASLIKKISLTERVQRGAGEPKV